MYYNNIITEYVNIKILKGEFCRIIKGRPTYCNPQIMIPKETVQKLQYNIHR